MSRSRLSRIVLAALIVAGGCVALPSPARAAGRICTSADTLSFGQRAVGTSTSETLLVSNCGDAPFDFTNVGPDPATSAAFHIASACATGMALGAGEQCAIAIRFEPTAPGQASGGVWLHNTTSTPDQIVTFYARGIDAQAGTASLAFEPATADFGAQAIGAETPALVLTLRNVGSAPLVPSALVLSGTDPYDFRGETRNVPGDCGIGRPVAPGASCTLDLYFKPQALGVRQATLVVDAPQLATLEFLALGGEGIDAPPAATVDVVEYHNADDGQFFLTADRREMALLDAGTLGAGWSRTGASFRAFAPDSSNPLALPVCRFFGVPGFGPASHFYTAYANECADVRRDPHWIEEGVTFRAAVPAAGACPSGYATVVRLWKAGAAVTDSRHRYVVDQATAAAMRADGWTLEGPVFCAPPARP